MRDPKRIDRILSLIKKIWEKCPDQRLGQLLSNVTFREFEYNAFFYEDDNLEKYLETLDEK